MQVSTITIPVRANRISQLVTLVVEPALNQDNAPVLLFLHGKGEAGSSLGTLPLVCVYQTPPFQAMLGRLPGTVVIAPQAPPVPSIDDWNWRDYIVGLGDFLAGQYANRRIVATGFSRGGLGVLQLISAYPDLIKACGAVDPQPARDREEMNTILSCPALDGRTWLRYGEFRNRDDAWKKCSSLLQERLPEANRETSDLSHTEMAVQAYSGSPLATSSDKKGLYAFLGLEFRTAATPSQSQL
jgi:pimeloyl-ACP methyl ester carboxylesterase